MSDQRSDYLDPQPTAKPHQFWVAVSSYVAAGYERTTLGEYRLFGLVTYGPTTAKLRAVKLRGIDTYRKGGNRYGVVIEGQDPPGPEAVRDSWAQITAMDVALARNAGRGFEIGEYADALDELDVEERRDDEGAEAFYSRIARAHLALAEVSDKPTAKLADLARVPVGTAASWVSRARAKGLYGNSTEGEQ